MSCKHNVGQLASDELGPLEKRKTFMIKNMTACFLFVAALGAFACNAVEDASGDASSNVESAVVTTPAKDFKLVLPMRVGTKTDDNGSSEACVYSNKIDTNTLIAIDTQIREYCAGVKAYSDTCHNPAFPCPGKIVFNLEAKKLDIKFTGSIGGETNTNISEEKIAPSGSASQTTTPTEKTTTEQGSGTGEPKDQSSKEDLTIKRTTSAQIEISFSNILARRERNECLSAQDFFNGYNTELIKVTIEEVAAAQNKDLVACGPSARPAK